MGSVASRLNWLRAGVLGANDGIVSAVLLALAIAGVLSATLGGAPVGRAVARNVVGGGLALTTAYVVGHLIGAAVG